MIAGDCLPELLKCTFVDLLEWREAVEAAEVTLVRYRAQFKK